uniref:Minor tail protein n=1 Tax=Siphoviridae sp. ctVCm11 TaxID=2826358 RepID=A0A8S5QLY2_9CAUD|nr:MAG TPA: minor tail protein [Siphoviridae sp. ctVCm11]
MAADGSVVFSVDLDDKDAQKELNKLVKKIDTLNDKIYQKQQDKMPLAKQSAEIAANLDAAKATLDSMHSGKEFFTADSIKAQESTVKSLQKEYDAVTAKVEKMDASIQSDTANLDKMKTKAGELSEKISSTKNGVFGMGEATKKADEYMSRFVNRVKKLALRAFVFTLITRALSVVRDYVWKVIQVNDEAAKAIGRLKGALLTLAQPLLSVIVPAFTALVNILTKVISVIANIVSMLFGTTAKKSEAAAKGLYKEADAIGSVGSAAKEAKGNLASFDEINTISTSSSGGGAAAALADRLSPVFEQFTTDEYKAKIDELTAYLSGALLALGAILCFSGANIPLGIALMAAGAIGLVTLIKENWNAMSDRLRAALTNVLLVLGLFALAIGAILCLSGANIPLGIGLMLAGAAMLGTAVALNWNAVNDKTKNTLSALMMALGMTLLAIGAVLCFSGANLPLGIWLMIAGAASIAASVAMNWNTAPEKTKAAIKSLMGSIGVSLIAIGAVLCFSGANLPLGIGMMIAGGAAIAAASDLDWSALLTKLKEMWQNIKQWWNTSVSKFFTADYWKALGRRIIDGLLSGLKAAWESVKTWVANAVSWFGKKFVEAQNSIAKSNSGRSGGFGTRSGGFGSPSRAPSISRVSAPALARGAVIPPNKEFLAVLGDQKSGTNIETPLATMVEAFKQAMAESGGGTTTVVIQLDGKEIARSTVKNINNMTRAAGKPVLLY